MADSLFSPYWYRAAQLHPRLISSAQVSRQCFRGEQWYIITSATGGRQFRMNQLGYQIVGRLDGRQSVQEIWDTLVRQMGSEAPSQHEVLSILNDLTAAGMIQSEYTPDLGGIFDTVERRRKNANQLNPLALRVPLFDPTSLLDALSPLTQLVFRPGMLLLWLFCMIAGVVLASMHWPELRNYADVHSLSSQNLMIMWLAYPVIKLIHELAHAMAIRHWQGEVREVGATLFLLVPVPYVNASAASSFPEKHQRMLVSAMGVIAETMIAFIALLVWLYASDGAVRNTAFACLLIGGMSTVLVNANPLMRYDGYYVLTDWFELPGLAARSDAWLRYLGERWLLGGQPQAPTGSTNQRAWLFCYGLASLLWRLMLYSTMLVWLLGKQFLLGLALGAWIAWRFIVVPLWQLTRFVFLHARLARTRTRAVAGYAAVMIAAICLLFVVPAPSTTRANGVVWVPDNASVRNDTEGFVSKVLAHDNELVKAGQILLQLDNQELLAEREQLDSRLRSLSISINAALMQQPGMAVALAEEQDKVTQRLEDLDKRIEALTLRAPVSGRLALPRDQDLLGRFLQRGSDVAHVVPPDKVIVRVALEQQDVDLLRRHPTRIEVRLADDTQHSLTARVIQGTPAASFKLPAVVLGDKGGGAIVTDPADQEGLRTLESFFTLDLQIDHSQLARIGSRAWVRFELADEPLGLQWARRIRQIFVKQLGAAPDDLPAPLS